MTAGGGRQKKQCDSKSRARARAGREQEQGESKRRERARAGRVQEQVYNLFCFKEWNELYGSNNCGKIKIK